MQLPEDMMGLPLPVFERVLTEYKQKIIKMSELIKKNSTSATTKLFQKAGQWSVLRSV